MKILITCLFTVFSSICSYGQLHHINLVAEEFQFDEVRTYQIEQVIDARNQRQSIGFVQKGITNKKRLAVFESGFEKELATFFNLAVTHQDQSIPVLFKFNEFKIWEETKMTSEHAYVYLNLEAYLIKEDGYRFISGFDSHFQARGMDVTSKHETNIIQALKIVLDDLSAIDILKLSEGEPALTLDELSGAPKRKDISHLPISTVSALQQGIYRSFDEFSNNSPGITTGYEIEKKPRKLKEWRDTYDITLIVSPSGKKIKEDVWGFSDGENAYIYFEKEFYPISISNHEVTFEAMHQPTEAINTAGIMGGALGGGIAALATKIQKKKMRINNSGAISYVSTPGPSNLENIKVYIYRPHKKERAVNIEVRDSNEKLLQSFEPGTFLELQPNSADEVLLYQARINEAEEYVQLKVVPDKELIFIEVSFPDKSSHPRPVIKQVDDDIGEYYLKRF